MNLLRRAGIELAERLLDMWPITALGIIVIVGTLVRAFS